MCLGLTIWNPVDFFSDVIKSIYLEFSWSGEDDHEYFDTYIWENTESQPLLLYQWLLGVTKMPCLSKDQVIGPIVKAL